MTLSWDSNPYAYGAIQCRLDGRKSSIGGISNTSNGVKGYFLSEQVYIGDSEDDAMKAVENYIRALPPAVVKGLRD